MKELEDVDTRERQTVSFLCEVNQVDVDGRWYRDDCRIRPGDNIKIRHQGERQAHAGGSGCTGPTCNLPFDLLTWVDRRQNAHAVFQMGQARTCRGDQVHRRARVFLRYSHGQR